MNQEKNTVSKETTEIIIANFNPDEWNNNFIADCVEEYCESAGFANFREMKMAAMTQKDVFAAYLNIYSDASPEEFADALTKAKS